jgi:hypothetical protein
MVVVGKRIFVATLGGVIVGFICYYLGLYFEVIEKDLTIFFWIMINRITLGFVIGVSILKMDWALYGAIIGAIMGIIFAYYIYMVTNAWELLIAAFIISILFGMTIEFITSVIFRLRVATES